ncbi:MAG: hypothetical protein JWO81_205 [Alphaproteobacteria bacterium]|nr:hypothetical protein [Alphaproteobacteria bacterium]
MTNAAEKHSASQGGERDPAAWARAGLIGGTGFVGGNLLAQRPFARHYSSATIPEIAGERFTTLICAGAPATMWAANADPEGDRANLRRLADRIATARFDRLVLISTIAVLDDLSAGYTESTARYETGKAYGRNRRELEATLTERHGAVVLRLPALFGEGLRKNFLFDLINPVPGFLKPEVHEELGRVFSDEERATAAGFYRFDEALQMMRLDRDRFDRTPARALLTAAFRRADFTARNFTNSRSAFQFYNLACLARDIERCLEASLALLHVCSEPIGAGELHQALLGEAFHSDGPPPVREDMRSDHARLWGSETPYLYGRDQVVAELLEFARARMA